MANFKYAFTVYGWHMKNDSLNKQASEIGECMGYTMVYDIGSEQVDKEERRIKANNSNTNTTITTTN